MLPASAATPMPAAMSSQKWLPVAMTANHTQLGQSVQSTFSQRLCHERGEREADDERVGRMETRHRRIGIRRDLDQSASVVQRGRLRERVDEAVLGEHAGRRCRERDVADEADHVRGEEPVPHARERLVSEEIDPEQRDPDDRELREPVRPVERVEENAAGMDRDPLQVGLDQRVERPLDVDDGLPVAESLRRASIGDAASDLVDPEEPEPDAELEEKVTPALGKPAFERSGHSSIVEMGYGVPQCGYPPSEVSRTLQALT